jgi:tetratricopeptide (TPR) repeat protein
MVILRGNRTAGIYMVEKKPKGPKKKWEFPIGITPMSQKDADAELDRFFGEFEKRFKDVPEAEIERGAKKMHDYMNGKIGWAELFNFTPEMLFQMAEFGFTQFKVGRYKDAERVFKVLTVLDWSNPYYHSVMGSILQKQKRYGEAIAEYSQAIELDGDDIVSHTNRGEIFLLHGLMAEAEDDFKRAIELDPDEKDRFAGRARMLIKRVKKGKREAEAK